MIKSELQELSDQYLRHNTLYHWGRVQTSMKYEANLGLLKCSLEAFKLQHSVCVGRHVPKQQVSGIIIVCY